MIFHLMYESFHIYICILYFCFITEKWRFYVAIWFTLPVVFDVSQTNEGVEDKEGKPDDSVGHQKLATGC